VEEFHRTYYNNQRRELREKYCVDVEIFGRDINSFKEDLEYQMEKHVEELEKIIRRGVVPQKICEEKKPDLKK